MQIDDDDRDAWRSFLGLRRRADDSDRPEGENDEQPHERTSLYQQQRPWIMTVMETKTLFDMFVLGLPVAEKILRPIVVYVFLIVGLRLAGKRELAQLNPFDLVVLLTLSNTVQNAIIGDDNSVTGGIIGATSLLVINHLVVRFLYKHRALDQLIEGRADVLIEDG